MYNLRSLLSVVTFLKNVVDQVFFLYLTIKGVMPTVSTCCALEIEYWTVSLWNGVRAKGHKFSPTIISFTHALVWTIMILSSFRLHSSLHKNIKKTNKTWNNVYKWQGIPLIWSYFAFEWHFHLGSRSIDVVLFRVCRREICSDTMIREEMIREQEQNADKVHLYSRLVEHLTPLQSHIPGAADRWVALGAWKWSPGGDSPTTGVLDL